MKTPEEVAALGAISIWFRSMKWLDIPTHRVLEVERSELMNEFDMYDEAGEPCSGGKAYLCSVIKTADVLSSRSIPSQYSQLSFAVLI
jgi:hypothetical protein